MSTLRFAPIVSVQAALLVDDGDELAPGPQVTPLQIRLADLKGSPAYEQITGNLPALQAEWDELAGDEKPR